MPGMSGLELQQELNRRGAIIPVVFITGHGDVPMAVTAMQQGAFDFLQKPFQDQELLEKVRRAPARDAQARAGLAAHPRIPPRLETLPPPQEGAMRLVAPRQTDKILRAGPGGSP